MVAKLAPGVMAERAACVVGWPAGHALALIHNYWLRQHGAGEYVAQPVPPEQFPISSRPWRRRR